MSDFTLYFTLGLEHVLDWQAYDHILFIIALTAPYFLKDWRKLLLLVSIFTLGHTISLVITNYSWFQVSSTWIEFLIPVSIIVAAKYHIWRAIKEKNTQKFILPSIIILFFGLIHGFGFGRYFTQINDEQALLPLIQFALGIEVSQIVIVFFVLLWGFIAQRLFKMKQRDWIIAICAFVIGMAFPMLIDNWPF